MLRFGKTLSPRSLGVSPYIGWGSDHVDQSLLQSMRETDESHLCSRRLTSSNASLVTILQTGSCVFFRTLLRQSMYTTQSPHLVVCCVFWETELWLPCLRCARNNALFLTASQKHKSFLLTRACDRKVCQLYLYGIACEVSSHRDLVGAGRPQARFHSFRCCRNCEFH